MAWRALTALLAVALRLGSSQIPDRLSLVRVAAGGGGAPLSFVDVFKHGEGAAQWRWPQLLRLPNSSTVLAMAAACNATLPCSSALPHVPCCADTDEQMPGIRRSTDGGVSFSSEVTWPFKKPFVKAQKVSGQMLWDPARGRVWMWFTIIKLQSGCLAGQDPRGLMLSWSDDSARTWSEPLNVSAAIAPEWDSLCVAPSGGNAALAMPNGDLLFMADVVGATPSAPTGGELLIRAVADSSAAGGLRFSVSRSLLQHCAAPQGQRCDFDEAGMTLLLPAEERIFVVLRSDPPVTHTYATALSTDSGRTFDSARFRPELTSADVQPSAMATPGGALWVAAPQLTNTGAETSGRCNMSVRISSDGGATFPRSQTVWPGPSMYSSLQPADDFSDDVWLFFERQG